MTTIFVYGTLMRDLSNHRFLERARFLGERTTRARYTLVDLGYYPGLLDGGTAVVHGELFEADAATLAAVDRLEWNPTFYQRRKIALDSGEHADAYFLPASFASRRRVEHGDWRRHWAERPSRLRDDVFGDEGDDEDE